MSYFPAFLRTQVKRSGEDVLYCTHACVRKCDTPVVVKMNCFALVEQVGQPGRQADRLYGDFTIPSTPHVYLVNY